ncbi:hypothetical protein CC78DRAFT_617760 [Lojkania enalia]|uniref:Zn(2)-C6 fungal-type domain-containing protein n=1 Tax=Lojkania enalia TaxID=147567 RepID=A0A9P4N5H1_9PLEO|nr:hypothetical protein CC78DRAFT_617760 [Didymosphaeria enalia]
MKTKRINVCHTCRLRKLGCDGRHPSCSQCTLTGRHCDGYERELVFVSYATTKYKTRSRKSLLRGLPVALNKLIHSYGSDLAYKGSGMSNVLPLTGPYRALESRNSRTFNEFVSLIFNLFLPESEESLSLFDLSAISVCGAWVKILPRLGEGSYPGDLVHLAVRYLGNVVLNASMGVRNMDFGGFEVHDFILKQLQNAVAAPKSFDTEIAASILCLVMVELMVPTSEFAFLSHLGGFAAFIESCPPTMFKSDILHAIFVGCRPILFFQAIHSRRSTFLSKKEWRTTPFDLHSSSKMQALISETSILPSILENLDSLPMLGGSSAILLAQKAKTDLVEVLRRLSNLEDCFGGDKIDSYYHTNGPEMYYLRLWFPNLLTANVHTHIWAVRIVCLMELEALDVYLFNKMNGSGLKDNNALNKEVLGGWIIQLATKICQSISYMLQDQMKLYGPLSAVFPLNIAYNALRKYSMPDAEEVKLCKGLINDIIRKGISIGMHFPIEDTLKHRKDFQDTPSFS